MTQAELLRHLVDTLEALATEYMIGGSQAAMYYGEPRLTRDIDVVVALQAEHLPVLLRAFPAEEFYVDEEAARDAVRTSGQFNIIHPGSGLKIDVYVNPDTPYDRARLARRRRLPLLPNVTACFASAEDVILYAKDRLAPYKVPKTVEVVDAIPRSEATKVSRGALVDARGG